MSWSSAHDRPGLPWPGLADNSNRVSQIIRKVAHQDVPFKTVTAVVDREINDLARWRQLDPSPVSPENSGADVHVRRPEQRLFGRQLTEQPDRRRQGPAGIVGAQTRPGQ